MAHSQWEAQPYGMDHTGKVLSCLLDEKVAILIPSSFLVFPRNVIVDKPEFIETLAVTIKYRLLWLLTSL